MGIGRILTYATIGVGAVAAAPFTGGGSLLGGAALLGSLGTGAAAGAVIGAVQNDMELDKEKARQEDLANMAMSAKMYERQIVELTNRALANMSSEAEYFNLIIALTALGLGIANASGGISKKEASELDEFISGVASVSLPPHVTKQLRRLRLNPPSSLEATLKFIEKVKPDNYPLLVDVMELASTWEGATPETRAFIAAFKTKAKSLNYHAVINSAPFNKKRTASAYNKYCLACVALGMGLAAANGEVSSGEAEVINAFINEINELGYDDEFIDEVNRLVENPPSFEEAIKYADGFSSLWYASLENMLDSITEAEGECEANKKFMDKWSKYRLIHDDNLAKFYRYYKGE